MSKIILKGIDYSAPVSANGNDYSVCTTAAGIREKIVDCKGFMLMPGSKITVRFTTSNAAASPALNINGTGAKPIYYNGSAISPEILLADSTYSFRYNGDRYDLDGYVFSEDYNDLKNKPIPVRVKGNAETEYRNGDVNITPADIGLGNVPNVSTNDQTPTFTQSAARDNIASGESLTTTLGKIMKWFADLKAVAFSGNYNDLSNKPSIPAAVAVKGSAESAYRTGNVNITPANIGLGNVNNTADASKSVNYAASAGNADTVDGHHFNWSGQGGQPSWLWGGNDSTNMYVYNPANFSVNYAASAGSANSVAYTNVSGRPTFTLSGTTLYINF